MQNLNTVLGLNYWLESTSSTAAIPYQLAPGVQQDVDYNPQAPWFMYCLTATGGVASPGKSRWNR